MAFKKGESGNPGGRPKAEKDVIELARAAGPDAIRALIEVAKDALHPARVSAANALLDRGYGKPTQTIDAKINILDNLNLDEQRALAIALAAIAEQSGDVAEGSPATHH